MSPSPTGRRYARLASVVRIRLAHPSSLAPVSGELRREGWQMKTRRRLGVSPGPVGLNGPVTVNDFTCGRPVESYVPALLRRNGRRRFVFSAIFRMNVAVTSRGPAFTAT